jgi:hypothetical protein
MKPEQRKPAPAASKIKMRNSFFIRAPSFRFQGTAFSLLYLRRIIFEYGMTDIDFSSIMIT